MLLLRCRSHALQLLGSGRCHYRFEYPICQVECKLSVPTDAVYVHQQAFVISNGSEYVFIDGVPRNILDESSSCGGCISWIPDVRRLRNGAPGIYGGVPTSCYSS